MIDKEPGKDGQAGIPYRYVEFSQARSPMKSGARIAEAFARKVGTITP